MNFREFLEKNEFEGSKQDFKEDALLDNEFKYNNYHVTIDYLKRLGAIPEAIDAYRALYVDYLNETSDLAGAGDTLQSLIEASNRLDELEEAIDEEFLENNENAVYSLIAESRNNIKKTIEILDNI